MFPRGPAPPISLAVVATKNSIHPIIRGLALAESVTNRMHPPERPKCMYSAKSPAAHASPIWRAARRERFFDVQAESPAATRATPRRRADQIEGPAATSRRGRLQAEHHHLFHQHESPARQSS